MKTIWLLPTLLVLTLLSGCTVVHKHYHYYQDDITKCFRPTPCSTKAPLQMHCGKHSIMHGKGIHGMGHHGNEHHDYHGLHHGTDKHGDKHGLMREKMQHMHHGQKGSGIQPCGAGCPCGCNQGEDCNCPAAGEDLEGLFNE